MKKNRGVLISLGVIVFLFAMTFVVGPLLSAYSLHDLDLAPRFLGPTSEFWFGSDRFGWDMWARVWAGTRDSLYIAFLAA